jgi:hypothetical protein
MGDLQGGDLGVVGVVGVRGVATFVSESRTPSSDPVAPTPAQLSDLGEGAGETELSLPLLLPAPTRMDDHVDVRRCGSPNPADAEGDS